jgi:hypothetical protein
MATLFEVKTFADGESKVVIADAKRVHNRARTRA